MNLWIKADWPAPASIHAYVTTSVAGNLGLHVGDDPKIVQANRQQLQAELHCPPIAWLHQTHSNRVVNLSETSDRDADGAFLSGTGLTAVVMTADCLPVLLCDEAGQALAAIHCGWRGLSQGILEGAVQRFAVQPQSIIVWFGPAISAPYYEVDDVVREAFPEDKKDTACFVPNERGRWQASLVELAKSRLRRLGVSRIYGGERCTFSESESFFSYRRAPKTGRFATLIWMA
ncbi:MAG: peptidoglycan editing factor PgeF [Gammaproteobacteria bacterium]